MAISDFTIIRRSLTSRWFSTVTTALTVGVAVALLVTLLSLRDAGRQSFSRGSGNMHMLISRDSSPLEAVLNAVFYASAPRNAIEWSKYERLVATNPFEFAVPTAVGDSYRGMPVVATTPEFFTAFMPNPGEPWRLREGRFFEQRFEVVAGAAAARTGGIGVGDTLTLTHGAGAGDDDDHHHHHDEFEFTVVGVLEATGSAHDRALFTELTSSWILHAHDRRERELGHDHHRTTTLADLTEADRLITGIFARVFTRPGSDASAALQGIFDSVRRDTSVTVASPADQIRRLFDIVSRVDQLLVAMSVAVLLSSTISIMLALYNSMEHRRRQIAVLRVLGCSRGRVFGLVLTESAVLGMAGALAGVAMGAGASVAVARALRERVGVVIDPSLSAEWALVVVVASVALAAVAGLIPAALAYRTPVAEHLRPLG